MKHLNKLWKYVAVAFLATSCADNGPLGFLVDKPESVALQEQINGYKALKTYDSIPANAIKLGACISFSDYNARGMLYRLVNRNFDELTPSSGMNHGDIVLADGTLSLSNTKPFIDSAKNAGLTVFGHTLVWNKNQNSTYLNSLIGPLIVTPPAIANSLDLSKLRDASMTGWGATGNVSVVANSGMAGTTKAVKMISGSTSSAATDLQLVTPNITVVPGHKYEIILYIKSDVSGEGRVAFEGLSNNTPTKDWTGAGKATATFKTGISWMQVKCQVNDFTGSTIKVHLDLGYKPNVTYYVDVDNFYVYDTQGPASIVNLISNGDFEAGNINGWGGWGGSSSRGISAKGLGFGNTGYAFYETNPVKGTNYWDVQTSYALPGNLENGQQYTLSFDVKADNTGIIRPEVQSANYSSNGFGMINLTTAWKHYDLTITVTAADRIRFVISYGEMAGTVYLDNVMLYKSAGASAAKLTVEKTASEKQQIITAALTNWISGVVPSCSSSVKAWNVVNEPLDDVAPYNLKTGVGKTLTAGEFYWQDYLGGRDYAVTAFNLARQNGNQSDLLFINESNLENLDKCTALTQYVSYIDSKGAKVDGIGTEMHISLTANKDNIAKMFQQLAATGKLIRVSELDVTTGSAQPSSDLLQQQADMYKYVVQMYYQYIPAAQRYGITFGSPVNTDKGLWFNGNYSYHLNYDRKPAYTSVADGLSQK